MDAKTAGPATWTLQAVGITDLLAPTRTNLLLWGLLIFVGALGVLLWGIGSPDELYFDETWYVPTARALLASGTMLHQEHPPLGKLLIAAGLWLFGDNGFGWRAMSAVFGAVTLIAIFAWSFALMRSIAASLWVTALTFFDGALYVQARIATLDVFLMAFCVGALAFFTLSFSEPRPQKSFVYALLMGTSLGLAAACKWSGFFLLFGIAAVALFVGALRLWRVRFDNPKPTDFFGPDVWQGMTVRNGVLALAVVPLATYALTYIPQIIHAGTIAEFAASHAHMREIMSGNSGTHPYASLWYQWPAMTRPVWYLFHVDGNDPSRWSAVNQAQAVLALANPVVLIAGEIAVVFAAFRWLRDRDRNAMIVSVGFFAQWLPWAVNPKGLEFFYYFFPSLLCLGPALGVSLLHKPTPARRAVATGLLGAAACSFFYFLPVLSAPVGVTPQGFNARIVFGGWR